MVVIQLSPLLHRVATYVKPEDLLLTKGSWVYFTKQWSDTHKWAKGKLFEVENEPPIVPYAKSYVLPGADYKDIDLSNSDAGLKLYPEDEGVLYETALGFKTGDFLVHFYIPKDKYIYSLAYPGMYPLVTDADLKYLGAKTHLDSPHTAPLLKLFFVKDLPAFILRLYVLEGVDFEKVSLVFQINKLKLNEIPSPTEEQINRATKLHWYTELTGI